MIKLWQAALKVLCVFFNFHFRVEELKIAPQLVLDVFQHVGRTVQGSFTDAGVLSEKTEQQLPN